MGWDRTSPLDGVFQNGDVQVTAKRPTQLYHYTRRRLAMRHNVTAKQPNSKMCLVCGLKNDFGLHASFYELDNGELLGVFTPGDQHQGYPDRLHGGIATAILDETVGRSILMLGQDV
jgi:hypothetical protein